MNDKKPYILYIDDEKANLNAFRSAFRFDYNIQTALSAEEAFPFLDQQEFEVILADQRMPEMTGVQFLEHARNIHPDPIRIILTAYSDLDAVIEAINKGQVFRYISKPWNAQEFKMTLDGAVKLYRINQENKRLMEEQQKMLDFVRMASHDLREPVRTIGSFMKLLKDGYGVQLDATANEYIDFGIDASDRMFKMISEILNNPLSKKKTYQLDSININDLLDDICLHMRRAITEKSATLDYKNLPTIRSNPTALFQVFQNLIANAIKYCQKKPHITISCDKKSHNYFFSVSDNGIGIAPDYTERIFQIFERAHSTESEYAGKGIGLATCKQIIEKLGGKIWVRSEMGKGSTFNFTLPIN